MNARNCCGEYCGAVLRAEGFTLLEVMLASLILALVVSMITLSLSGSLNVMEATRDQGEVYYRAQVALERISDDLASAVLPDSVDFVARPAGEGETDTPLLRFVSTAHVIFDPLRDHSGLADMSYALRPDPEEPDTLVLLRSDRLLASARGQEDEEREAEYYLLADRLRAVRFFYINQDGEALDAWDTRADDGAAPEERDRLHRLPVAVRCELEFWLDREEGTSLPFQTLIELPAGRIRINRQPGA